MSKNYTFFNPNPTVKIDKKTGKPKRWTKADCVVRAFCGALNKTWDDVFNGLCEIAFKVKDMPNSYAVIDRYVKENNMVKVSLPTYMKLSAFAKKYNGVYVAKIRGHVACIKNNKIYDAWDCGDYKVKTYYELKK